jgi:hypothetical protein
MGTHDLQTTRRYRWRMNRLAFCAVLATSGLAAADARLPVVNDPLPVNGADGWPTLLWLYDNPSMKDAAGKVVIHWFCSPKVTGCTDDLARITTLKENNANVYLIAYINGTKPQAQKLDPIRGSEGVGRGSVAFGPAAAKWFKSLSITGPMSFVVDVDGKVKHIALGTGPADLDARDAKVTALTGAIKLHTTTVEGPKAIKANEKFTLSLTINLAGWLVYSRKPGTTFEWKATVPRDIKCDHTSLTGDQVVASGQNLTVKMTCSGPRGSYEAAGQIQFGYATPSGAVGIGADGAKWKFEITN